MPNSSLSKYVMPEARHVISYASEMKVVRSQAQVHLATRKIVVNQHTLRIPEELRIGSMNQ